MLLFWTFTNIISKNIFSHLTQGGVVDIIMGKQIILQNYAVQNPIIILLYHNWTSYGARLLVRHCISLYFFLDKALIGFPFKNYQGKGINHWLVQFVFKQIQIYLRIASFHYSESAHIIKITPFLRRRQGFLFCIADSCMVSRTIKVSTLDWLNRCTVAIKEYVCIEWSWN